MSSPARVPTIAAQVVRFSPWVSTNDTIVTVAPKPDRQHEWVPAREQERDQDPDRQDQRQGERDQRADTAPAGHADRDDREQDGQTADERQPPAIDDREGRRPVRLLVDRDDDLVADPVVGQLELARRTLEVGRLALAAAGTLEELDRRGRGGLVGRWLELDDPGVDPLGDETLGAGRGEVRQQDEDRGDRQQPEREQDDLAVGPAAAGSPRPRAGGPMAAGLDGHWRASARDVVHRREPTIGRPRPDLRAFDRTSCSDP